MKFMGYYEGFCGFGNLIGPLVTMSLGFADSFYLLAITGFVLGMAAVCSMPSRLNNSNTEEEEPLETGINETEGECDDELAPRAKAKDYEISMWTVLCNRNGLIVFVTFLMANVQFFSFSSSLSPYLVNSF